MKTYFGIQAFYNEQSKIKEDGFNLYRLIDFLYRIIKYIKIVHRSIPTNTYIYTNKKFKNSNPNTGNKNSFFC